MLKSDLIKFFALGLVLLLAACSSAEASRPEPVKEILPVEAAPLIQTQAENMPVETLTPANEMAEKPAVEEEAESMVEKPTMAEEKAATNTEAMAGEPAAKVEESAPMAESMVKVEETAPDLKETAPVEEKETMPPAETMVQIGPTAAQAQLLASLDNQGLPPELHNEIWLNSAPLKLADLRGKVVIVEFWTFGCINCKHVVPALRAWHQQYQDEGLVIIGVHTPEFGYEAEVENVKQALVDQDIPYVVAIDNDWQTWRAYNNRYWPAKYFIDKAGNLRYIHIGEGGEAQQEEIIRAMLAENLS